MLSTKVQTVNARFGLAMGVGLVVMLSLSAPAQTYTVLHNFTGGTDGGGPYAGLTMDRSGNLFGTTEVGGLGPNCCGVVFELVHRNAGWIFTPLYAFTGYSDGAIPASRVTIGPDGTLYGSTLYGGNSAGFTGAGVVFNLRPPPHFTGRIFSPWDETVIYQFGNPPDGANPWGDLVFDAQNHLYGGAFGGGVQCAGDYYCGAVYQLTPRGSGWTENILYTFTQQNLSMPRAGFIFDGSGNLYGTLSNSYGAIIRLSPSGSQWIETTLYQFMAQDDASGAAGGLVFDPLGNLYGATVYGGTNGEGAVYELTPSAGGWTERVLYSLGGNGGSQSSATLARDAAGNLYGTTCYGGAHNRGAVFKLTPSGGGWTETTLHDFSGGDGGCPWGQVILDGSGNIYGTTSAGGAYGIGVVFAITP